jgi:hypothetical protein
MGRSSFALIENHLPEGEGFGVPSLEPMFV